MKEIVDSLSGFFGALRSVPFWLLAGTAAASYALLFAPSIGDVDISAFRKEWGALIWASAVGFTALAAALALELVIRLTGGHIKNYQMRRSLRLVPIERGKFWHLAKQQDGTYASQISLEVHMSNMSDAPIKIVKVELLRPRRELIQASALLPMAGSPYHSSDHLVPARGINVASIHIMVRGSLGRRGQSIRPTIAITDQFGVRYVLRRQTIGTSDKPEPRAGVLQFLRSAFQFHRPSDAELSNSVANTWAFSDGFEYLEACRFVLREEKRSYGSNGRQKGGLGSLNVTINDAHKIYSKAGANVPNILCPTDEIKEIQSENLNRILKIATQQIGSDQDNLQAFLLSQLSRDGEFAEVGYFIFMSLHRLGRTLDALTAARDFLSHDKVHGYSNVLGVLSVIISREYNRIDPNLFGMILSELKGDKEYNFRLLEKLNAAQVVHIDGVHHN